MKIGRNAIVTPATNRGTGARSSRRSPGTTQASVSAASSAAYSQRGRVMRTRRATSMAASTLSSTPANTAALTAQVVPKSRANCTTFLVSSSRNATPMKNRSVYGRHLLERPADHPHQHQRREQHQRQHHEVERRDGAGAQVGERAVVDRRLELADAWGPGGRAAAGRGVVAQRQHRLLALAVGGAELHAGRGAVDRADRVGVAVEQPGLVVVVHRERAARPEQRARPVERLGGEEVVLEAQRRLPGDDRRRVGQGEQHEVVARVGALHEGAPVVDVHRHPRVGVGLVRMPVAPDLHERRVDLDRVDPLGALARARRRRRSRSPRR